MTNKNKSVDSNELTKLLRDSIIVRIVSIISNTTLSILELLEYNLTRKDINYALASGVIVSSMYPTNEAPDLINTISNN
ncbi:MAG: hypothetical protein WAQ29_09780 [Nitrososphaeraceae archaeon]